VKDYEDPRWLPVGTVLNNRYRVCKVIGSGGFGITYQVWDTRNEVYKAVKEYFQHGVVNRVPGTKEVLVTAPKRREEFLYGKNRLLDEARIVAKFQSPAIVRVDDYFEENNTAYMVMEYLQSQTLENYIRDQKAITPQQTINIGVHICEALEEIHNAGVIHRDISPDNIFVTEDGSVKIIDFGSARLSREDTDDRLIVLKPGFAPPEQYEKIDINNDRQKEWTDIYALGATLYVCLTGRVPAESSDRKADFDTDTDRVCYPHEINSQVPDFLSNTIMKAMAINIHERFANASQLKAALLQEQKVLPIEVVRKKKKLQRAVGIGASIVLILLLAVAGIWRYSIRKDNMILNKATVSVWYAVSSNEDLRQQKIDVFESIRSELASSDKFSEIVLELNAVPEGEYEARLEEAYASGNMPLIFESPNVDAAYLAKTEKMQDVLALLEKDACYFLDQYGEFFRDSGRIPMGFHAPVIYINTSMAAVGEENLRISSVSDLMSLDGGQMRFYPISLNGELTASYAAMFTDFAGYEDGISQYGLEDFLNEKTAAYLADTADYYTVRNTLQSNFQMIPVGTETAICRFCDYWSISSCEGDEETAAKEVLAYFFTNFVQDRYYIQTNLPGLPLEKASVQEYAWVTRSLERWLADLSIYVFEKQ
jgi:serine/threonine protein kinase